MENGMIRDCCFTYSIPSVRYTSLNVLKMCSGLTNLKFWKARTFVIHDANALISAFYLANTVLDFKFRMFSANKMKKDFVFQDKIDFLVKTLVVGVIGSLCT